MVQATFHGTVDKAAIVQEVVALGWLNQDLKRDELPEGLRTADESPLARRLRRFTAAKWERDTAGTLPPRPDPKLLKLWRARRDSNTRPLPSEKTAQPI
jgi:hypothetical protein